MKNSIRSQIPMKISEFKKSPRIETAINVGKYKTVSDFPKS
jgi:hypothetical protein